MTNLPILHIKRLRSGSKFVALLASLRAFSVVWLLLFFPFPSLGQVQLPKSLSPNKQFAVFIETDKDQSTWKSPPDGEYVYPMMWIEELKTHRRVCSFKSDIDENDDQQPLRSHYVCFWAPDSQGLALIGNERFDHGFTVYRLLTNEQNLKTWTECSNVDAFGVIEKITPDFKEFKGRPHAVPLRWETSTRLVYEVGDVVFTKKTLPEDYPVGDYIFTVDYSWVDPCVLKIEKE